MNVESVVVGGSGEIIKFSSFVLLCVCVCGDDDEEREREVWWAVMCDV